MTVPPPVDHCETPAECVANALTHGLGLLLAVGATAVLLAGAAGSGDPLRIATLAVFGATLIATYLASTLFHAATYRAESRPRRRRVLQTTDHIAIYLLIAGTYTPIVLVALGEAWGWILFGVIWALAGAGIVFKLLRGNGHRGLSTAMYLAMGWLVVVAGGELVRAMSPQGLAFLAAGGVAYTVGAGFYLWRGLRFSHAVWHCFVIVGSACHVAAMWVDVVRA